MRARIIDTSELPGSTSRKFEGDLFGGVHVSFFVSATPPGRGPALHKHPYEEIFVVEEGTLTFTVGDEATEVTSGHVVIVPPETPHKFVNTGSGIARHVDIHASGRMEQTWLEEQ